MAMKRTNALRCAVPTRSHDSHHDPGPAPCARREPGRLGPTPFPTRIACSADRDHDASASARLGSACVTRLRPSAGHRISRWTGRPRAMQTGAHLPPRGLGLVGSACATPSQLRPSHRPVDRPAATRRPGSSCAVLRQAGLSPSGCSGESHLNPPLRPGLGRAGHPSPHPLRGIPRPLALPLAGHCEYPLRDIRRT
jgi:hypothetical protein